MVIATPEPKKVPEAAEAQGVVAKEIGRVTEKSGIRVRNKGVRQDSLWLDFALHNS